MKVNNPNVIRKNTQYTTYAINHLMIGVMLDEIRSSFYTYLNTSVSYCSVVINYIMWFC